MQVGNAVKLKLLQVIELENEELAFSLENLLHKKYSKERLQGEWFKIDAVEVDNILTMYKLKYKDIINTRFLSKQIVNSMNMMGPRTLQLLMVAGDTHRGRILEGLINTLTGKIDNIVFDSGSSNLAKELAQITRCSIATSRRTLKWLIEEDMVQKIGKTKLMINPYEVFPAALGNKDIAYLQALWDNGSSKR